MAVNKNEPTGNNTFQYKARDGTEYQCKTANKKIQTDIKDDLRNGAINNNSKKATIKYKAVTGDALHLDDLDANNQKVDLLKEIPNHICSIGDKNI